MTGGEVRDIAAEIRKTEDMIRRSRDTVTWFRALGDQEQVEEAHADINWLLEVRDELKARQS